ncbi:hypothetical protein GCM10023216_18660 [Isoptericola chiayiensis]|uniref:Uncharacterized protein n=1 Tax=Isoptericola chiayiensis TaxID=579446 RepID=A0ABP8YEB9_9MICO|nr:hypothetical protein [Isoptericola chiayiensis]NOW00094.1 hypothetical protein [Isoptericola chiayiensis]
MEVAVRRISAGVPGEFEAVVGRFEDLVPAVDVEALGTAAKTGDWSEVERWAPKWASTVSP